MNTLLEDAEKKKKSLTAVINNGRLAMMAIIGVFDQELCRVHRGKVESSRPEFLESLIHVEPRIWIVKPLQMLNSSAVYIMVSG